MREEETTAFWKGFRDGLLRIGEKKEFWIIYFVLLMTIMSVMNIRNRREQARLIQSYEQQLSTLRNMIADDCVPIPELQVFKDQ